MYLFSTIFGKPAWYYDAYTRTYACIDGARIDELEFYRQLQGLREEEEKRASKIRLEFTMKCIESSEVMSDMLNGYAPSTALSRAHRRKNNKWNTRSS